MLDAINTFLLLMIGAMVFITMACSVYVATRLRQAERKREAEAGNGKG